MQHMISGRNLGLITTRQTRDKWDALVSNTIITHKSLAAYDINTIFPLYLYPSPSVGAKDLIEISEALESGAGSRRANLSEVFIRDMEKRLGLKYEEGAEEPGKKGGKKFGPDDILHYIYAVFHSPSYRERYAEFLKGDFPRVPLTSDAGLFWELCGLGSRLTALHLLEGSGPAAIKTSYPVDGSNEVDQVRYVDMHEQVQINNDQYFGGIPKAVWEFHVGGYRVCEKWLKDRKGRKLSLDDISHYQKVVAALAETISIMAEIDAAIMAHGGFPLWSARA